jgi:hypothetical protein
MAADIVGDTPDPGVPQLDTMAIGWLFGSLLLAARHRANELAPRNAGR